MTQNASDGGTRNYILVQLPEPLDANLDEQKDAAVYCDKLGKPRTIAELTKERLRRAGRKIREELTTKGTKHTKMEGAEQASLFSQPDSGDSDPLSCDSCGSWSENALPDLGFRVFKLDSSNLRTWEPDPGDLERTLLDHLEHVKPGRTEQDLLYELLLKLGLDLCVPIETRIFNHERLSAAEPQPKLFKQTASWGILFGDETIYQGWPP